MPGGGGANMLLEAGDYFYLHYVGSISTFSDFSVSITALPIGITTVALPTSEIQTYSARIANNGTANVISTNHDFIKSVTTSATGRVDIVYKAGTFTVTPEVQATTGTTSGAGNMRVEVYDESPNGCSTYTGNHTAAAQNRGFNFSATKQGADAKPPGVFVGNVSPYRIMTFGYSSVTLASSGGSETVFPITSASREGDLFGTVASSNLTLPPGEYFMDLTSSVYRTGVAYFRLYDVTGAATLVKTGSAGYCQAGGDYAYSPIALKYKFTITTETTYEIRGYAGSTNASGYDSSTTPSRFIGTVTQLRAL